MAIPRGRVPELVVDPRKSPDVILRTLSLPETLALPAGSLACLDTPLALASQAEFAGFRPRSRCS